MQKKGHEKSSSKRNPNKGVKQSMQLTESDQLEKIDMKSLAAQSVINSNTSKLNMRESQPKSSHIQFQRTQDFGSSLAHAKIDRVHSDRNMMRMQYSVLSKNHLQQSTQSSQEKLSAAKYGNLNVNSMEKLRKTKSPNIQMMKRGTPHAGAHKSLQKSRNANSKSPAPLSSGQQRQSSSGAPLHPLKRVAYSNQSSAKHYMHEKVRRAQ